MLAALKIIGLIALGTIAIAYIIVEVAYRMNNKEKPEPPRRYRH
jgi:hypothetical protein